MLKKIAVSVVLLTLFGIINSSLYGQNLQKKNNVQIISSFDYSNEWGQDLAKKIKKGIESSIKDINADIFYSTIDQTGVNPEIWKDNTPKLMIVIGYQAWMAIKSFNDSTLKKIPIIICGIENNLCSDYNYYLNNHNIPKNLMISADSSLVGYNAFAITIKDNSEETIELISSTLPNVQNIIYLSESSYSDYLYTKRIDSIINIKYPSLNFLVIKTEKINNNYIKSIEDKINKPNSAIILNNYHTSDNPEIDERLSDNFETPLFSLKYKHLKNNNIFTGGIFESINNYSNKIVSTAVEILSGKNPVKIQDGGDLIYFINKTKTLKLKMETGEIPAVSFINAPESRINRYVIVAMGTIIIPALFIIVIMLIIRASRKRKRSIVEIEKYSESLKKYNVIYKNIPVGIATFNDNGSLCEGNAEFMKMVKIILPDLKLSNRFNLLNSDLVTPEIVSKISIGEITERNLTIKNNSSQINGRIIFTPVISKKEKTILVTVFDTTQIVNERERRDNINSMFTKAITESRLGVAELDLISGKCTATDGWYKGLGINHEESIEKCFANVIKEDKDNIFKFIEKVVCNNATKVTENIRIKNLDSSYHWVKLILKIKECDQEKKNIICSAILIDIDARKQKEEQLKETYMKIIKANRIKNSFISNMSHEIRTPLNAIVGFSELLVESSNITEQKELLKYLEENNDNFLKLITDIVDMSRIESGSVKCTMSEIDLNEMMEELAKNAKSQVNQQDVKIIFNHGESGIVYSDKERLQQVMGNFIANAIKFTKKGKIEIGYKFLSKKVQLFVKDTGSGITEDKKDKLFNRFSKFDKEYMGLGLGLPIANSIIKLLGGEIGFETEVNTGSTFWCIIQSEYIGTDNELGIKGKLENATIHLGGNLKTILIAEDNENNFQLLNFILKGKFKIIHAANGEKAVELYKTHNPDLILMDIKMPIMDGYQATAAIREISQDVPIIAVTAYAFNKDKEKIMDSSFTAFIAKPVRENELTEAINNILNK